MGEIYTKLSIRGIIKPQGLMLARQILYCFSHASSPKESYLIVSTMFFFLSVPIQFSKH
jgi:hypothetical protein